MSLLINILLRCGTVAVAFMGLCIGFTILESLRTYPRRWSLARPAFRQDAAYFALTFTLTRLMSSYVVFVLSIPFLYLAGRELSAAAVQQEHLPAASLPHWVQVPLLVIGGDFIGYWVHRWFHARSLWRFHAIHHMAEDVTWATYARVHPINDIIIRVSQGLPFIMLGFSPAVLAPYVPLLVAYGILQHADLPWDFGRFRSVLASPAFHRWHHTKQDAGLDKNFAGLLPLWDLAFGTYYMPLGKLPQDFGIRDETPPSSIVGQVLYPFRTSRL